jgi:hypothetical protein
MEERGGPAPIAPRPQRAARPGCLGKCSNTARAATAWQPCAGRQRGALLGRAPAGRRPGERAGRAGAQ